MDSPFSQQIQIYAALDSVTETAIPSDIATTLVSQNLPLLSLVKALAPLLTNEDAAQRSRGVALLSNTLVIYANSKSPNRQETIKLTEFLTSALSSSLTEECFLPLFHALTALAQSSFFGNGEASLTARSIFENISLLGKPQSTRYIVYNIIDVLMSRFRSALLRMNDDFIKGFSTLVTNEKDPRNLKMLFALDRVIGVEFDLQNHIEDFFDVTFCYFPITFTPPKDDPYHITSEELQEILRSVLASTPLLGPLAMPLFLDKLQAASANAKRQTLRALQVCMPVYGKVAVETHSVALWEALVVEVMHTSDPEVEDLALKVMNVLLALLYPEQTLRNTHGAHTADADDTMSTDSDHQDHPAQPKGLIEEVAKLCFKELKAPSSAAARSCVKILSSVIGGSGAVCSHLLPHTLTQLLSHRPTTRVEGNQVASTSNQVAQLESITALLAALRTSELYTTAYKINILEPYKSNLVELYATCLHEAEENPTNNLVLNTEAIKGLSELLQCGKLLSPIEQQSSVKLLTRFLLDPNTPADDDEVGDVALEHLRQLTQVTPSLIAEITLPALFSTLDFDTASNIQWRKALACLSVLCTHPHMFELLVIRLMARLNALYPYSSPSSPINPHSQTQQGLAVLSTLTIVIEEKLAAKHSDIAKYSDSILSTVFAILVLPTLTPRDGDVDISADRSGIMESAGKLCTLIMRALDAEQQKSLIGRVEAVFKQGDVGQIIGQERLQRIEVNRIPFQPFQASSNRAQQETITLYNSIYASAIPQTVIEVNAAIPQDLLQLCIAYIEALDAHTSQSRSIQHALSNTVNKFADHLRSSITEQTTRLWQLINQNHDDKALTVQACIAQALIYRGDALGYQFLDQTLSLLSQHELQMSAARILGRISSEKEASNIKKENHSVIKFLWKQRFFSFVLPKLVEGYQKSKDLAQDGMSYIVALASLLPNMPQTILISNLTKILPLLLKALEPSLELDCQLRAHAINAVSLVVREASDSITDQAESVVLTLMKLYQSPSADSIVIRLATLKCLAEFPATVEHLVLHKQRTPVLKMLERAVDDRKKVVRKEAVDCRAKWYLYTA